jgi:XTP/dITP diphosphohydrolase
MKLVVATHNLHKAHEIQEMLKNRFDVLTLKDIGFLKPVVEDGNTFEENAKIKVRALADFFRLNAKQQTERLPYNFEDGVVLLADDSGLEVDVLNGEPGVLSARYAGEPSNDKANTEKLLKNLEGVHGPKRTARFRCTIAAAVFNPDKEIDFQIFQGACEGKIGFKPKGEKGFGYDPIFFPDGYCSTFAEISAEEKNKISHRARAMGKFKTWIASLGGEVRSF